MQTVSLPSVLASALLGLLALHCGPPVAERPAPTPVYVAELSLPPTNIIEESLRAPAPPADQGAAAKDESAPDTDHSSSDHSGPDQADSDQADSEPRDTRGAAAPDADEPRSAQPPAPDPRDDEPPAGKRKGAATGTAPTAPTAPPQCPQARTRPGADRDYGPAGLQARRP